MTNDTASDFLAAARTDDDLMERIYNRANYMPETVEASLRELYYRDIEYSDEDMQKIHKELVERRVRLAALKGSIGFFDNDYKAGIVKDPDAPKLYTPVAICMFTILVSPLMGSVLMAMNISKTGKESSVVGTVIFGIVCAVIQVCIFFSFKHVAIYAMLVFGVICAYGLNQFFWKPCIGFGLFYRARPVGLAVLLVLLLIVVCLLLTIYKIGF